MSIKEKIKKYICSKKGMWGGGSFLTNFKSPQGIIVSTLLLVIGIQILATALPLIIHSILTIGNISGLPFVNFFQANGIIFYAIAGAVVIGLVALFMGKGGRN